MLKSKSYGVRKDWKYLLPGKHAQRKIHHIRWLCFVLIGYVGIHVQYGGLGIRYLCLFNDIQSIGVPGAVRNARSITSALFALCCLLFGFSDSMQKREFGGYEHISVCRAHLTYKFPGTCTRLSL